MMPKRRPAVRPVPHNAAAQGRAGTMLARHDGASRRVPCSRMLAGTHARTPVPRPLGLWSDGKDQDAVGLRSIDERERKVLEKDSARTGTEGRSGERKCKRTCCSFCNCVCESQAQARLDLGVIRNLRKMLQASRGQEPRLLHLARRLASANTSSAENVCASPLS